MALSAFGSVVYHSFSESHGGASLGKWICGLRIHSAEFSPDGTLVLAMRPCTLPGG